MKALIDKSQGGEDKRSRSRQDLRDESPPRRRSSARTPRKSLSPEPSTGYGNPYAPTPKKSARGQLFTSPERPVSPKVQMPLTSKEQTSPNSLPAKLRAKALGGRQALSPNPADRAPSDSDDLPAIPKHRRKVVSSIQNFVKSAGSARALKWCRYEWFYSEIDAAFFQHNEFQQLLNQKGLAHVTELTRPEWSCLRSQMYGKPRRLSPKFLTEEREKLIEYRANVRRIRAGGHPIPDVYTPVQIPQPLRQNTKVLVFHENRFKGGSILEAKGEDAYSIQFDDLLGPQTVSEIDCMPIDLPARLHTFANPLPDATQLSRATMPYTHEDLRNVSALVPLLEKKEILLGEIRIMNDHAERLSSRSEAFPDEFRTRYAKLIVRLDEVNRSLEPALAALRGRNAPLPSLSANQQIEKSPQPAWLTDMQTKAATNASLIVDHVKQAFPAVKLEPKEADWKISQLIQNCIVLLLHIQSCAENPLQPHHVNMALDTALHSLSHSDTNKDLFADIRTSVAVIKSELYKLMTLGR